MNTGHDPKMRKLVEELQNGSAAKRRAAAYKLGKSKDPVVVSALIGAAEDADAIVRQNAINALSQIDSDDARTFLSSANIAQDSHGRKIVDYGDLLKGIVLFFGINFVLWLLRGLAYQYNMTGPLEYNFATWIDLFPVLINIGIIIVLFIKRPALAIGMLAGIPIGMLLYFIFLFFAILIYL